jgi:hypothetical protein
MSFIISSFPRCPSDIPVEHHLKQLLLAGGRADLGAGRLESLDVGLAVLERRGALLQLLAKALIERRVARGHGGGDVAVLGFVVVVGVVGAVVT